MDGGIFFYGTLELEDDNRQSVDKYDSVRDAELVCASFYFKLVDDFEDVVFRGFKINEINVDVFPASVFTVEDEAVAEKSKDGFVGIVERDGGHFEAKDDAFDFAWGDSVSSVSAVEVLFEVFFEQNF